VAVHLLGGGGEDRSRVDLLALYLFRADEAEEGGGELLEALGLAYYSVGLSALGGVRARRSARS
jgi:hypothetical protein